MYRQDYILRLIEQFAKGLRHIRDRVLRRAADRQTVTAEVGEMARQAGLDLDVARRLDETSLLLWLAPAGLVDQGRLWLMAELLYLEGLAALEEMPDAARADLSRALAILGRVEPHWRAGEDLPTASELSGEIRRLLAG